MFSLLTYYDYYCMGVFCKTLFFIYILEISSEIKSWKRICFILVFMHEKGVQYIIHIFYIYTGVNQVWKQTRILNVMAAKNVNCYV